MPLKSCLRRFTVTRLHLTAALAALLIASRSTAQDVPLISGAVGFFTDTDAGQTSYVPIISPVLSAPIGSRFLIEGRGVWNESFVPRPHPRNGYAGIPFWGLTYLQGDYLASSHVTVSAGDFVIPFGTYNTQLTPVWINSFESEPIIFGLGTMSSSGLGGEISGSAVSRAKYSLSYTAYFSGTTTGRLISSQRSTGGQTSLYFPNAGLEIGASYGHRFLNPQQNFEGFHVWWEPTDSPFRLRSEYAHGEHSQGYWVETDYRLSHFGGTDTLIGRLEPVFRMQQAFRNSPDPSDLLPPTDTQRADFGLDYYLAREVRMIGSYSRQFASTGNLNVWQTGVTYRFLFPAWRGKK
jgi:hypothetical protein